MVLWHRTCKLTTSKRLIFYDFREQRGNHVTPIPPRSNLIWLFATYIMTISSPISSESAFGYERQFIDWKLTYNLKRICQSIPLNGFHKPKHPIRQKPWGKFSTSPSSPRRFNLIFKIKCGNPSELSAAQHYIILSRSNSFPPKYLHKSNRQISSIGE